MAVPLLPQRTLRNVIHATGVGLHSGSKVCLTLRPAAPDAGIVFRRVDVDEPVEIPARLARVSDTRLCTTLACGSTRVATVEHLMAALAGMGIDNAYVDIDGPEVPIMDGSAAPFVFLLQSAGICAQPAPKHFVRIRRPIEVRDGDKWARLEPYDGFKAGLAIDFRHPVFEQGSQQLEIDFGKTPFVSALSRARTFGFLRDLERLRAEQLALGGSLDNAVVLDDYRVLNPDGLRSPDEFVRHKLLDALGDLYLFGHGFIGAFNAFKTGHALNHSLLQTLAATPRAWEIVTLKAAQRPAAYTSPAYAT